MWVPYFLPSLLAYLHHFLHLNLLPPSLLQTSLHPQKTLQFPGNNNNNNNNNNKQTNKIVHSWNSNSQKKRQTKTRKSLNVTAKICLHTTPLKTTTITITTIINYSILSTLSSIIGSWMSQVSTVCWLRNMFLHTYLGLLFSFLFNAFILFTLTHRLTIFWFLYRAIIQNKNG